MNRARLGPLVTLAIAGGVALIFILNRETTPSRPKLDPAPASTSISTGGKGKSGECQIGDEVVKNHIQIAAVWLPGVNMAGMPDPSDGVIHLEADVQATADNPNGFAKDEFVPYLKIKYDLRDLASGKSLQSGDLLPMVASDGLHYGANIAKPAPGSYRLIYAIEPPSSPFGRHVDAATGVAAWWPPFEASFEWVIEAAPAK